MPREPRLTRSLRRWGIATGTLLAALTLAACGSDEPPPPAPTPTTTVETTATATPTPTTTPTPTPTTPTPTGPVPAERIDLGTSANLANIASQGFPPPPPMEAAYVPNEAGVARIVAPTLGIDHYLATVGIVENQMETPEDGSYAVGWYASTGGWEFGVPGEIGNSIFTAHETWAHMQGPFYQLHQARQGDEIYLDMADGERRHYQVMSVTRYDAATMPMGEILWPSDRPAYEEWLTLYTCGGEIVYGANGYGDYAQRDVLVARWVGSTFTP